MKANSKILAIAVVAMFCTTAVVAAEMSEDSQAADTQDYHIYLTFLNDKGKVTHSLWLNFSSAKDAPSYADAATKALQQAIKGWTDIGDLDDYAVTQTSGSFWCTSDPAYYCGTACNLNGVWAYSDGKNYQNYTSMAVTYYIKELYGTYFGATKNTCVDGVKYFQYQYEGVTYYDRLPDAGPNDFAKKSNNTILYVAIAIIVILVILALAYYFLVAKKKNAAA